MRLPLPPISGNKMYGSNRYGHRYLVREAKDYKEQVMWLCKGETVDGTKPLCLQLTFYFPYQRYYNKNGTLKRIDTTNYVKLIEDAIAEGMGYDDKQNVRHVLERLPTDGEGYVDVTITEV